MSLDCDVAIRNSRILQWWDYVFFVPLAALNLTVAGWFFWYWAQLPAWRELPLVMAALTFLLAFNVAIALFRWFLLLLMVRPVPVPARPGWKVGVATTFVPGGESLAMLEKTVAALVAMRYAHDTWVLDEGDDDEVKALCARLGARHFTRKGRAAYQQPEGAFQSRCKHGNYNAWLSEVGFDGYDIVVGFDPDHVPQPEFLELTLGYFDDPAIGYVQAPQTYYNQGASFIARGAAEETYAYYSTVQMSSYGLGYPIVTGCHQLHRVTALREVGGFAAHDADDLLITLLYRAAGWQGVYVPEILAKGLTPVDWPGYLRQQLRWARSVVDVKLRAFPKLAGSLPVMTRLMSFLHGFYYVQVGITGLMSLAILAFMLATNVNPSFMSAETAERVLVLAATLYLTDLYRQRFYLGARREWGIHWRIGLLWAGKWPYILLGTIDALSGNKRPYTLTLKVKSRSREVALAWPQLVIVGVVALSWLGGLALGHELHPALQLWAGATIVAAFALMWTETWRYPEPFDGRLLDAELARAGEGA